jgi:hypothetical protein
VRTHVVLVPGFGGFDAFGAMKYYAGITGLFQGWRAEAQPKGWSRAEAEPVPWEPATWTARHATALHYFDNEPTAAVATRAASLERFLAKLVLRGTIALEDRIALVGHSTGGLDLRHLVRTLLAAPDERLTADGAAAEPVWTRGALLERIERVVFLSVPQRGTNIADWLLANGTVRAGIVRGLRAGLLGAAVPVVPRLVLGLLRASGSDLVLAARDVVAATALRDGPGLRAAEARRELSDVALWLDDAQDDFLALRDLRAGAPGRGDPRPAHDLMDGDVAAWPPHVRALSFATRSPTPFFDPEVSGRRPRLREASTLPRATWAAHEPDTDGIYRLAWWVTSAGPFAAGDLRSAVDVATGQPARLADYDNDGIVNTASMIWPEGETRLVRGDHGDVLGHYRLVGDLASDGVGRRYVAYDLLRSGSGWTDERAVRVWREVLDFCAR